MLDLVTAVLCYLTVGHLIRLFWALTESEDDTPRESIAHLQVLVENRYDESTAITHGNSNS